MQITINQHYVPRFYMKYFANIKNAPISSICSEDYFYDQDGRIENALAVLETMWNKALKNAIDDNLTADDIESIKEFVLHQIVRTKAMLSHNREMATTMM